MLDRNGLSFGEQMMANVWWMAFLGSALLGLYSSASCSTNIGWFSCRTMPSQTRTPQEEPCQYDWSFWDLLGCSWISSLTLRSGLALLFFLSFSSPLLVQILSPQHTFLVNFLVLHPALKALRTYAYAWLRLHKKKLAEKTWKAWTAKRPKHWNH